MLLVAAIILSFGCAHSKFFTVLWPASRTINVNRIKQDTPYIRDKLDSKGIEEASSESLFIIIQTPSRPFRKRWNNRHSIAQN